MKLTASKMSRTALAGSNSGFPSDGRGDLGGSCKSGKGKSTGKDDFELHVAFFFAVKPNAEY